MTDREKAIVMAYTGTCMLTGDKFQIFHKYVEDIMGRPIWTHEIGLLEDEIKQKSEADFIALCAESSSENANEWIPVKFRPLTDEEQKEVPDYCCMTDCQMPDDGEEILVTTKYGIVEKDECGFDDGYYLDSGYDWQTDIAAWMPLPEPYKAESEDKDADSD